MIKVNLSKILSMHHSLHETADKSCLHSTAVFAYVGLAGWKKPVPCIQKAPNSWSTKSSFSFLPILLSKKKKKKKLSSLKMPFAFNTTTTNAGLNNTIFLQMAMKKKNNKF